MLKSKRLLIGAICAATMIISVSAQALIFGNQTTLRTFSTKLASMAEVKYIAISDVENFIKHLPKNLHAAIWFKDANENLHMIASPEDLIPLIESSNGSFSMKARARTTTKKMGMTITEICVLGFIVRDAEQLNSNNNQLSMNPLKADNEAETMVKNSPNKLRIVIEQ